MCERLRGRSLIGLRCRRKESCARRTRALTTLAGFLLLTTGPTSAAAAAPQPPAVGPTRKAIAWTSCGERLECARVRVPRGWDTPSGPKINLSVIRRLASRPDQRFGSLIINPGG